MRRVMLSLMLAAIFALGAHGAYGCVCNPEVPTGQALREATAVFVGRVTFVEVVYRKLGEKDQVTSFVPEVQVKLEVESLWKGTENKTFIVRTSAGDCGYRFTLGERYLIYAYGTDVLTTSGCTRTTLLARAAADLKELGRPRRKLKP